MAQPIEYVKLVEGNEGVGKSKVMLNPQLKLLVVFTAWQTVFASFVIFTLFLCVHGYLDKINLVPYAWQTLTGAIFSFIIMTGLYYKLQQSNRKV